MSRANSHAIGRKPRYAMQVASLFGLNSQFATRAANATWPPARTMTQLPRRATSTGAPVATPFNAPLVSPTLTALASNLTLTAPSVICALLPRAQVGKRKAHLAVAPKLAFVFPGHPALARA